MNKRDRKPETEELLKTLKAVDSSSRRIESIDMIDFYCHLCDNIGSKNYSEAKRTYKKHGFAYQCSACLKSKYKQRGPEWLKNVRKAANSKEHKTKASLMAKQYIQKYFPEDIQKVLDNCGVVFEGDISNPGNTIKVTWPDGVSRKVRIRRFMIDGFIVRPKIGLENTNHIKHLEKLKELGLTVEKIDQNMAVISYKDRKWQQYWNNSINSSCLRMIQNINLGIELQALVDSGMSLSKSCKQLGVDHNRYYRNLNRGVSIRETAEATLNFAKLIDIPNAIYNKVLDGTECRPDILLVHEKLIIEVDGLYYHTEDKRTKRYHQKRCALLTSLGYKMLSFTEYEVKEKRHIVNSMINHKLGKSLRINLRKCEVKEVSWNDASAFFEANHLMGSGTGKTFGVYYNNELVSGLRYHFINNKKSGNKVIHISRFCNKVGISIAGAYSKLLSLLPKEYDIVNFIDKRHGTGEGLLQYGFVKVGEHIGFGWTDGYYLFNRRQYLGNSGYDYGLKKVWDYGQIKYIKKAQVIY